jgi:hypothetical protein
VCTVEPVFLTRGVRMQFESLGGGGEAFGGHAP